MKAFCQFTDTRQRMVVEQLRARGIKSTRVLAAMQKVPRELFVPVDLAPSAYADQALAIDCGQTISQPYIVAAMTEAMELSGNESVLEIGTGSGYQTAILAELATHITTIERHARLLQTAKERLNQLGYTNVHFVLGDGYRGCPDFAPYDRIIVTAAAPQCPPMLWEQLNEHGILVGPFGPIEAQTLQVFRKIGSNEPMTALMPCRFVPLVSDNEVSGNEVRDNRVRDNEVE